jgi:hypothetical protein
VKLYFSPLEENYTPVGTGLGCPPSVGYGATIVADRQKMEAN